MQPDQPIKIQIMHADPVVRAGLRTILLSSAGHLNLALEQSDCPSEGTIVLTDYDTGIEMSRHTSDVVRVMIVAQSVKEWEVRTALESGVLGYVPQSCVPDVLAEAVIALSRGQRYLTDCVSSIVENGLGNAGLTGRESEVLQLLGKGYCNKMIARELRIGLGTVKCHVKSVLNKLNARARTHAVVVASQRGLIRSGNGINPGLSGLVQAISSSMRAAAT
jgi:DNA-binding NarL/FixJ family response regulator